MTKVIFESAARAIGTHNSAAFTSAGFHGARVYLDCTAITATGTIAVQLQSMDAQSGKWVDIPGAAFPSTTAVSTQQLSICPGIAETANISVSDILGDTMRVVATVATAGPMTFSMSVDLVR